VHLVVIDLIPALLSWEGRDFSREPAVAPGSEHAMHHIVERGRVVGVADAGIPTAALRRALDDAHLGIFFERITTSAGFGPVLSARVLRRMAAAVRISPERVVVVTARKHLVKPLNGSRFPVVMTSSDEFERVPDALEALMAGRISP